MSLAESHHLAAPSGTLGGQLSQPGGAVLRLSGVMHASRGRFYYRVEDRGRLGVRWCGPPGSSATGPEGLGESLPSANPGFPQWPAPETRGRMFLEARTFEPKARKQ